MCKWSFSMERRIAFTICVAGVLVFMSVVQAQDPRGTPGVDFPNYFTVPETSFKCSDQKYSPGFYADLETKCQVFHFCYQDRQESFLCPTGTIFNQAVLTCDVWYRSNCSLAQMYYSVNAGPIMERAGKNLPMLLRLRNRSQTKPSTQPSSNVFDKVSSLYETPETPSTNKNSELTAISNDKSTESFPSDSDDKNKQMAYGHELDLEKDNTEDAGNELIESDETENADTIMVYDNMNDRYYKSYGQQEEWQDSEPVSEEFSDFYDYRDPENEYGADEESSMKNYDDEYFEDERYPEFTRRSHRPGHSRVRRKPMYVVLDDQPEADTETADNRELDNSESREGKQVNATEPEEEVTPRPEPFPRPTPIPHHLLNISSETPMTSEEFESAIWKDLILPQIPDDHEGPILNVPSDDEDTPTRSEEAENQSEMQSDDETIYIENDLEPERYAPYVSQYEEVVHISETGDGAHVESYSDSQQEETASSDADDTFVLIPDEYDGSVVDSVPNENAFEIQSYPEETVYGISDTPSAEDYGTEETVYRISDTPSAEDYGTEETVYRLSDSPPAEDYGTYENAYEYSSNMDYPQQYQETYYNPEMAAEMYQNEMPSDQMYAYETDYEVPRQSVMNYASSNFEDENMYTQTEYPYAETELPVEADRGSLSNEEIVYVLDDQPEVETLENTRTDYEELDSLVQSETREGKQMNVSSEAVEEDTPRPEPFPRPTPIPHHLLNISSETPMTSEEFESAIWKDLILPQIPDDHEGPILNVPSDEDTSAQSTSESDSQSDDETIYIKNDLQDTDSGQNLVPGPGQEPGKSDDVYYVFDFDEQSSEGKETRTSEDENEKFEESLPEESDKIDEETHEDQMVNSTNEESSSNVSLDNESESLEPTKTDDSSFSQDPLAISKDEQVSSPDAKTVNPMNTLPGSNFGQSKQTPPVRETVTSLNSPFSTNMGNFDFSTDSRFLNNMGYSESMDFGPYGFGPNMGQFSMMDSMQQSRPSNFFSERMGQSEQANLSPLSAIQQKVRSMKQGKFGAFKKYMSSTRK